MAQTLPSEYYVGRYFKDLMPTVSVHPDYKLAFNAIRTVRDCVEGSNRIKHLTYCYLPHPSMVDTSSKEQQARYAMYIQGAEFDNFPDLSRRGWLGKMQIGESQIDLPTKIEYLEQNADGDGSSLRGVIESTASNVMQAKYHVLLADYKGLSDVDVSALSLADIEQLAPSATIKQYARENLVQWHFARVNGKMQLVFAMLRESGSEFDTETMDHINIDSYLILALDENGRYYQQKMVKDEKGERSYVTVGGSPLTWIPLEIVCDEELPVGELPRSVGMLYPICESALYRYRVSADYKEAMRYLVPTTFTSGWKQGDKELFNEINGREQMQWGPGCANNLPEGVEVDIKSVNTELEGFERYFDANADKVRAMGGTFKDKAEASQTATEADINASEQNAMLETVASQLEQGFRRIVSYCAMFEGVWSPDDVENRLDDIVVGLPRDFASPKLSVEEARLLLDMVVEGIRTREQVVKALAAGGWDYQDAEQTMKEIEESAPTLSSMANSLPAQQVDTGQTRG